MPGLLSGVIVMQNIPRVFSDFQCLHTHCKRSTVLSYRLRLQLWGWESLQKRGSVFGNCKTLSSCSDPLIPLLRITQKAATALIVSLWLWMGSMAPAFLLHSCGESGLLGSERKLVARIVHCFLDLLSQYALT